MTSVEQHLPDPLTEVEIYVDNHGESMTLWCNHAGCPWAETVTEPRPSLAALLALVNDHLPHVAADQP